MKEKLKLKLIGGGGFLVDEKKVVVPREATKQNLGIWADADNNAYYEGVTAKKIMPKPEDFMLVPFRLISSTVVASGTYRATRFPEDVLKASMNKLIGCPVYTDHSNETVTNCIGKVASVFWQEPYTDSEGNLVPSGINGEYAIDCQIAPNVARNLISGGINSNSVTVEFYWQPSHQFVDDDFYYNLGTVDNRDGKEVCRLATEILYYEETSPVTRGADPFAKAIDEKGNVINPDFSRASYSLMDNDEKLKVSKKDLFSVCENQKLSFSFSSSDSDYPQGQKGGDNAKTKEKLKMNKKLLAFLAAFTATQDLKEEAVTDEFVVQLTEKFNQSQEAEKIIPLYKGLVANLKKALNLSEADDLTANPFDGKTIVTTTDFEALKLKSESVSTLEAKVSELQPLADAGTKHLTALRAEAKRLLNLTSKGSPSASLVSLIEKADIETAQGFIESYGGQLAESQFKATCSKCGTGEHVSFRTSESSQENKGGKIIERNSDSLLDLIDRKLNQ